MSTLAGLRAELRRDPTTAAIFALAALAVVAPIWVGRYLPLLDYPNHLASVFVWTHLQDPAWGFSRYYGLNLAPLPYWAQYAIEYAGALLVGAEVAQKLFATLCVLGLPAGVAIYARRVGRDPRLALFAFPLAWNGNLANGFLSYCGGLAVLFAALAALDRHAERPGWRFGAIAAAAGTSLYFFHILAWGMFLAMGSALAVCGPRRWSLRGALLALAPTVPTLLVGLWCYRYGNSESVNLPVRTGLGLSGFVGVYNDLATALAMIPGWLIDFFPGGFDERCAFALGLAWLLLLAGRPFTDGAPLANEVPDRDLRSFRHELAALACFALYVVLPRSLMQPFYWFAVNRRLAVAVGVCAALLPRGRIAGPGAGARRAFFAFAAAAAIAYPVDVARHVWRFNQRARDFDTVVADLPRGSRVLPLPLVLGDPEVNVNCFNQWGSIVQTRVGGYMVQYLPVEFPIRYLSPTRWAAPPWNHPDWFNFAQHGAPWDFFLVHGPSALDPFAGFHDRVRLARKAGEWELWEKLPAPLRTSSGK